MSAQRGMPYYLDTKGLPAGEPLQIQPFGCSVVQDWNVGRLEIMPDMDSIPWVRGFAIEGVDQPYCLHPNRHEVVQFGRTGGIIFTRADLVKYVPGCGVRVETPAGNPDYTVPEDCSMIIRAVFDAAFRLTLPTIGRTQPPYFSFVLFEALRKQANIELSWESPDLEKVFRLTDKLIYKTDELDRAHCAIDDVSSILGKEIVPVYLDCELPTALKSLTQTRGAVSGLAWFLVRRIREALQVFDNFDDGDHLPSRALKPRRPR